MMPGRKFRGGEGIQELLMGVWGGGAGRVHTLIKKVPFFPFALLPMLAKTYSKISKFYILEVE